MSKTLQQVKDEVAKGSDFIRFPTFYDQTTIPEYMIDQIAIRYAQEQNKELVEMLTECASVLRWTLDNAKPDSDWTTFTNSITNAMVASEELIKSTQI